MSDRPHASASNPAEEARLKRAITEAMSDFYRAPPFQPSADMLGDAWYPGKYAIEAIEAAVNEIKRTVGTISTHVGQLPGKITHAAETLEHMLQPSPFLTGLLGKAEGIEAELQKKFGERLRPKLEAGLGQLEQMITLIHLVQTEFDYIEKRFGYAANSLASLNKILDKGSAAPSLLVSLEGLVVARSGKDAMTALLGLAEYALVHANPAVGLALAVVHGGGGGVWSKLFPYSLAPGDLDAWINEEKHEDGTKVEGEEREFRKELVAALDHYCRGKFGNQDFKGMLRAVDQREAIQTLVDLTSVLFSTLFGYVLRHPKLPSPTLPKLEWAHPFHGKVRHDDMAAEFAITFSRHFSYQIKSVTGLVARGFWEVSSHNEALVETVSAIASNLFSSLIESFLHNLLWSVEIHETYGESSQAAVWRWNTREKADGAGALAYQVYVRPGLLSDVEAAALKKLFDRKEADVLKKLLADYGAYADALRPYRAVDMTDAAKDEVAIAAVAGDKSGSVKVTATSTYPTTFPSIPVLRAYCNGKPLVMKKSGPANGGSQGYECTFVPSDLFSVTKGDTIYVRSNYGGATSQAYS
jgi:hypothetical protein